MKTQLVLMFASAAFASPLFPALIPQPPPDAPTEVQIVERGYNHQVLHLIRRTTQADGKVVGATNRIVQLS